MKTFITCIIATIITCSIIIGCACAMPACAEEPETFELLGVITEQGEYFDCIEYTVTLEDGEMIAFYADPDDFHIGDMVWLLVWDEEQQEVLDVWYVTNLEPDEMFRWLSRTDLR